ncbi:MAG: flagellar M-ring protein FliF [Lachnospiraceae bacterium]|nr:flagellar M-ring protein FliF [Lachnospiraceae bacterium]
MLDRLKAIQTRIVEFWNRFTSKQKTLIVCITAAVVFTLVALIFMLNRAKYVELVTFDNTADAATAKTVLDEAAIDYNVSSNGLTFMVNEKQESTARLKLGENNIAANKSNDWELLFDNSMSTTDSERRLKQILVKQNNIAEELEIIEGVKQAAVQITIPDSTNTLLSKEKEASASILLTTTDKFEESSVDGIANFVATSLGNSNTDNIRIIDQTGNLLFGSEGGTNSALGNSSMAIKIKAQVTDNLEDRVRGLMVNSGVYNDAEVTANLDIDLNEQQIEDIHHYTDDAEEDTGPKTSYYYYTAENQEGATGIPGTDSNDDNINDYEILNGNLGNSNANVIREEYNDSVTTTTTKKAVGTVNTANSSLAVVLSKYVIYDEAKMKKAGELKGTNFEAFQAENDERKPIEVDEGTLSLIQNATGISAESITVQAYEVPLFYPQETSPAQLIANYLQFILALLIVILLVFVVVRGMRPVEVTELEPELSVEALLATTKENQSLEDIEFSDKSATRVQIERFVDQNPEEVALLLRNWLNDEWD